LLRTPPLYQASVSIKMLPEADPDPVPAEEVRAVQSEPGRADQRVEHEDHEHHERRQQVALAVHQPAAGGVDVQRPPEGDGLRQPRSPEVQARRRLADGQHAEGDLGPVAEQRTADDAAAIEGQISGRLRGSMRAKMLRGAFSMAARDIGEPDVDFTNPIERANPERLRKIRQVILQRAHAADFGFDEGDLSSRMALEDSAGEAIEEALSQLRGAGSIIPDGAPVWYAGDSVGADYVVLRLMYPTAAYAVAGRLSYEIAQADGRGDVLTVPADDVTLIKEREDADEYAEDEDVLWGDEDVAPGADR
jgi:hypothetical protein